MVRLPPIEWGLRYTCKTCVRFSKSEELEGGTAQIRKKRRDGAVFVLTLRVSFSARSNFSWNRSKSDCAFSNADCVFSCCSWCFIAVA